MTELHAIAAVDMLNATSRLQIEAGEVRQQKPNWASYLGTQMIAQDDYNFITQYEQARTKEQRAELVALAEGTVAPRCLINTTSGITKDTSVRYILTLFDDMLQEDKSRVELFHAFGRRQKRSFYSWLLPLLQRPDQFVVNQTSAVIAKLAIWSSAPTLDGTELEYYINFLKEQLKANGEYVNTSARCLQMLMRVDAYRRAFVLQDGLAAVHAVLTSKKTNFQLQYQLIFSLWCIAFNGDLAAHFNTLGLIQALGDILAESGKEKVIRIVLATFRNVLEKLEGRPDAQREAALQMVQSKTLKTLELIDVKKFDDPDLQDDINFLAEKLHNSVADLSSFDEYCSELRSGRLAWSPVHKSEKFWRENAHRFNDKSFELVKMLIRLLETSQDPLIQCVAAHDLGEYVRHYPRGKTVVETYQGKSAVMRLLSADDPNVRYHALLAVQKLMVHNWEYLGKQLDAETGGNAAGGQQEAIVAK